MGGWGVEEVGGREAPQRVTMTRWGSFEPASVRETHQRLVGGVLGRFRRLRGLGGGMEVGGGRGGRWCWHRRWRVDPMSQ